MRKYLRFVCFLFAGILPLAAQSGRNAWFACLSKPEGLENPVKVLAGEELTELELPEYMASKAVKIPEDGIIRIVREVPDPEDPAKTKYLILAQAQIPEGVGEALIILLPFPKPEGDLLFQSKVQDLADFKGGDRLFINLSDTHVRVKMGKTMVPVAAKKAKIYEAPVMAKSTNMPIMYEFYHPERKEWKILTASTVVLRPTRREICVFNNGSRIGKIKKHKILFPVEIRKP